MNVMLESGWRFTLAEITLAERPDFDDSAWRSVTIPHDWQIEQQRNPDAPRGGSQGYFAHSGIGWYRLRFPGEESWCEKVVRLCFDGVQRFSEVWLNGVKLGGRPYGYVPFRFDVTGLLRLDAENVLAVRVDNSLDTGDRWYSGAGIFRKVFLRVEEPVHIQPERLAILTTRQAENSWRLDVEMTVENHSEANFQQQVPVLCKTKEGKLLSETMVTLSVPAKGEEVKKLSLTLENPPMWSVETPSLCCVEVKLPGQGISTTFGFREAYFDGEEGFFLNGTPVKLKGVNLHHDGGVVGAAVPIEVWHRRLQNLKKLGCNALRCSHNPQAEEFYELADTLGFLVIDELYDKWAPSKLYFDRLYEEWWEQDLSAMIERDRNHPCIILWSVGNEIEYQYEERFYENTARMCKKTRELDPSRPVSLALMPYCFTGCDDRSPMAENLAKTLRYAELVDVLMLNYMESNYRDLKAAGLKKAIIGSEIYTCYRSVESQFTQVEFTPPYRDVQALPYVAGSFLWAGIDYLGESMGWPCRGWTGSALDSAGFEKIRSWYLESQWKDEPVLKLAIFDESEPWDMANNNWGFPQMRRHWNYGQREKLMHIAAFTNCPEVQLFLNDEPVRTAPLAADGMAHFLIPYRKGVLTVKAHKDGQTVTDTLRTAEPKLSLKIDWYQPDDAVLQAEIRLLDEHGQLWTTGDYRASLQLTGGVLLGLDSGDFLTTTETYRDSARSFFQGHLLAIIQRTEGAVYLRVEVPGIGEATATLPPRT